MTTRKPHEQDRAAHAAAVDLLRTNLTPAGILAATPSEEADARRYTCIFGRDASICALGMAASGEPDLLAGARAGLRTLAEHRASNGQIPKFVDPAGREPDFWYLGCIDATLWWLIAVDALERRAPDASFAAAMAGPVRAALDWLRCQEHPRLYLAQQNEASDWADIMPRSGFVLYSNALWYAVKRRYHLPSADATFFHFNHLFYPFSRVRPDYRRLRLLTDYLLDGAVDDGLYLSFVNLGFWGDEGDVFGNLLAVLFGLAEEGPAKRIIASLRRSVVDQPRPVRAVVNPIARRAPLWRPYMDRHGQNRPWQYHNGGCWPFIGGFWSLALDRNGAQDEAREVLAAIAEANYVGDWGFYEWFQGETGRPRGMRGQSWNAAIYLLAEAALTGKKTGLELDGAAIVATGVR